MTPDTDDYRSTYDHFWKELVEDESGNLDRDKVMRELSDYYHVLDRVPKVYCEITNGRISKPNTDSSVVISVYQTCVDEIISEVLRERAMELLDALCPEDAGAERAIRDIFPELEWKR